tara:strand:+ start:1522 stop:2241 length:720 start_codon:yes stop_codon:yes gene_type:complete
MNIKNNIKINDKELINLKPLKKNFTNKNNKFSAKGYIQNTKVKIYEVFSENQGELREFVQNHHELSKFFPKLITFNKKYIVEEWVEGKTLRELTAENEANILYSNKLKEIINLMWSVEYDEEVFNYIEYIHHRVKRKNNFDLTNIPKRINHNDLSLDNILITSEGLKIIDNELLGCNTGWILNIKNSFIEADYSYQNFISIDNFNELWNIRKEWSKIVNKNSDKKSNFFKMILKKFKII